MANPLTTSVGVGVIDTGIDASDGRHPEFVGVNFGETLPFNLKDLPPLKLQELFFDFLKSGHGTKVAGVIGANNISATSSINYKFPQMNGVLSGVRGLQYILEAQPLENLSFIEFGTIIDSFGENINVINMSISSNKCSEVSFIAQAQRQCVKDEDFSEAIAYYADGFNAHQDKLFVVGAANENKDVAFVSTPANLGFLNNVLTVGSTNLQDGRSSFSNFGFAVGIAAPGEHIYAPAIRGKGNFPISGDEAFNYVTDFSGTSASAPMVTGVAAILKSIKPELTPGEIKNILTRTADSLFVSSTSDEAGKLLGSGCSGVPLTGQVLRGCRLNALKAVKSALSPWIEIPISNPPPAVDRHGYSAVYDQNTNHLIFFGGVSGTPSCCASFNDVWILTNANGIGGIPQWIQLFPFGSPPKGRSFHSAVYDQTNNRMIIFGGGQFNGNLFTPRFNDVWVLTNANGTGDVSQWIELFPTSILPQVREGHRASYDPDINRMVIFGGGNNGSMDVPQDAWILTNANGLGSPSEWHELSPSGSLPSRLERYAQAYDSLNNRFTVFGGCCFWINALRVLINAVSFNQSSWIQLFPSQPIPSIREVHAFAYDSNTNRLIIFGGGSFLGQFNDIWVLTNANGLGGPSKWHNSLPNGLSDSPPVPSVGVFSPAIYDSSTNRLSILYRPDDLWILTDANSLNHSFSGSFAQSTSFTPISFPTWPSSTSPFVEF